MAEITLNRYLAKLEALQRQGLHHEVSLHARHILEKYPKNAAAHRLLAHALLAANQHDEAEHEFRRVLSAYPDDADPYMGLSRIAAFRRRYDEAIGYAERAADLKPGDADIARALRDLYADHRGIRDARIPQGAYTVALQQRRAGLLNRAVDTLKAAVAQHPERIDLRVLLAEIHWDNGSPIEAAELAIEILKGLPNCVSANRVLTQLWLGEQRPSDAQRYLSFVEAVDPYTAFELISDGAPPENAFTIDELDYQSEARRQLATLEPDWLDAVDADQPSDHASAADEQWAPPTELEAETTLDDLLGLNDDSDWLTAIDEVKAEADSPTRTIKGHVLDEDEHADLLSLFDDIEDDSPPAFAFDAEPENVEESTPPRRPRSSMPSGLLRQLDSDEDKQNPAEPPAGMPPTRSPRTAATGLSGLLRALENDDSGEESQELEGTGVTGLINELEREEQATGVTDLINELERGADADEGTGVTGLINELERGADPGEGTGITGLISALEGDRTDEGTGVTGLINELERGEVSGGTGLTGLLKKLERDDEGEVEAVEDEFEWLSQTDVAPNTRPTTQLDPDLADIFESSRRQTGLVEPRRSEPETVEQPEYDPEDPMAWMRDSGIELFDAPEDPMAALLAEEADDAGVKYSDPHENDPMAWMRDEGIEVMDTAELRARSGDTADLSERRAAQQEPTAQGEEQDPLSWMQDSGIELLDDSDVAQSLDWMRDTNELGAISGAPLTHANSADLFTGLDNEEGDAMSDRNEPGLPEWDDFEDGGDESPEETPDWLASIGSPSDAGEQPSEDADVPEWLSGVEHQEGAEAEDADFALADDADDEPADVEAPDMPDWLRSAQPAQTLLDDDLDEEEAIAADMPDWLAAAAPATLLDDAGEDFDADLGDDEQALLDAIGQPTMLESPADFDLLAEDVSLEDEFGALELSEVSDVAEVDDIEAELSDSQAMSWLADLADEDADSGAVVEADFVSAAAPDEFAVTDDAGEVEFDAVEFEEEAEEEAVSADEVPDWLVAAAPAEAFTMLDESAAEPVSEPDAEDFDLFGADEEFDALEEADEALAFDAGAQPEWPASEGDEEFEEAGAVSPAADEMPDWLAAAAPVDAFAQVGDAEETGDEDLLPADMPEWLAEEDVEMTSSQLEEAAFDSGTPDWLTEEESLIEPAPGMVEPVMPQAFDAAADAESTELPDESAAEAAPLPIEPVAVDEVPEWSEADADDLELLGEDLPDDWMDTGGFVAASVAEVGDQALDLIGDETPEDWMDTGDLMADLVQPADDSEVEADLLAEDSWIAGLVPEDSQPLPFSDEPSTAPDWLAEAGSDEPATFDEFTPLASLGDLEPEDEREEAEISEQPEQPDWLAGALAAAGLSATGDILDEADDSGEPQAREDEEEEFLAFDTLDDEEAADGSEEQADAFTFESATEDEEAMADFAALADLEADLDLADAEAGAEISGAEVPDWLTSLQAEEEALVAQEQEDEALAAQVDEMAWLEVDEDEAAAVDEPLPAQTPEWLADTVDEDSGVLMEPGEMPDWLEVVGQSAQREDDANAVEDALEEMPQWLADVSDLQLSEDEMDLLTDSEEIEAVREDIPDWLTGTPLSAVMDAEQAEDDFAEQPIYDIDEDAELAFAESERWGEQIMPTPAENAPDWLNAMVPGLDVDYTAQDEDAPLESEYAELAEDEALVAKASRDYAWVQDIVDEELRPPAALPTATQEAAAVSAAADAAPAAPRFNFTRAPRWLRRLRGEFGANQVPVNTLDDLEDNANAVPDWLTFDDDDDSK